MNEKLNVGDRISRYQLKSLIRTTELIREYEAFDEKLERDVILKLIVNSLEYSSESIEYFLKEARTLAQLNHPSISKVLDFGKDSGYLFVVSEKVPGIDLNSWIDVKTDWREAVTLVHQIADAMSYAHNKGVIHRDLKPENILVNDHGQPILSDFSLVRIIEDEETKEMTGTHVGLGSPAYISPEQGKGLGADYRSDIYSLGVILFELITGQKPFNAENSMEFVIQHVTVPPPIPIKLNPNIPKKLNQIILKALEKDIGNRYQSMSDLSKALEPFIHKKSNEKEKIIKKRKTPMLPVLFVALLILLFFILKPFFQLQQNQTVVEQEDGVYLIATLEPTKTKSIATVTFTPAPTKKLVDTPEPQPTTVVESFVINKYPVLENNLLPDALPLSTLNISQIQEIARWGIPKIEKIFWIRQDNNLLALTGAGYYFIDPNTIKVTHFYNSSSWLIDGDVSDDSKFVISGDKLGNIHYMDILSGETKKIFEGNGRSITSLDISNDGKMVVKSDESKTIQVYDIENEVQLFNLGSHQGRINRVKFLKNQHGFVSAGDDYLIFVWDEKGQPVKKYYAQQKINDFDITSDNKYIALALADYSIQVIELETGKTVNKILDAKNISPVSTVKILSNDSLILSSYENGEVKLWNLLGNEKIWEIPITDEEGNALELLPINQIALSSDGLNFFLHRSNGKSEIWNLTLQKMDLVDYVHYDTVNKISLSINDQFLAIQKGGDTVEVWKFLNSELIIRESNVNLPLGEPFSNNENFLLLYNNSDLEIHELDQENNLPLAKFFGLSQKSPVKFLQDDKMIASYNSTVRSLLIYSSGSLRELTPEVIKNEGECKVVTTMNQNFLAAGSNNGIISDTAFYKEFCNIQKPVRTTSTAIFGNGEMTAFGLEGQAVEIWLSNQGNQNYTLSMTDSGKILDVAFSIDGKLLAAASESGKVFVYNLETYELVTSFYSHTDQVTSIAFSNNGRFLITGSLDGTVRIWGNID